MIKFGTENTISLMLTEPPSGLIPITLDPIKVDKLESPLTSSAIIDKVRKFGMGYQEIPLPLFRASKFGKARRVDSLDLINGYPQYGTDVKGKDNLISMRHDIIHFRSAFMKDCPEYLYDMEDEDFRKTSILRTTFTGRHLQPPVDPDITRISFPEDLMVMLRRVCAHYHRVATYTKSGREAILDGTDAKDTALGPPSFSAGEDYHARRLITLKACPPPDYAEPPSTYVERIKQWGSTLFSIPEIVYASYLSFRQGATIKPIPLWYQSGFGYTATHSSTSLYTRQRAVWAAPFWLNVILTPLVLRFKSSRKAILGMWHDPEAQSKYVPKLQAQGSISIEVDYSAYDTTIRNSLMVRAYMILAELGYSSWEAELIALLTHESCAVTPSFVGDPGAVAVWSNEAGLMSGLLPTSEIGSLLSITFVLTALQRQQPAWVEKWFSGDFTILVQSDDVLTTLPSQIDLEAFSRAFDSFGIKAKVKEGSTFLKVFLPVGKVKNMAKPFSRNVQQTYGNEDTYDGKPPAILRLALSARTMLLPGHPLFASKFPELFDIYAAHFDYVKELDRSQWLKGDFTLSSTDLRAIEQYAQSLAGSVALINILERAKFDPSAASILRYLTAQGIDLSFLEADQVTARREYTHALFDSPTNADHQQLIAICKWAR